MKNYDDLKLTCFVPAVSAISRVDGSKFCGSALLPSGDSWPCCKVCNVPMQLFVQLSVDGIPDQVQVPWSDSAVQLFYCTNEACTADEGWNPDVDESKLVRIIPLKDAQWFARPASDTFPDKFITGWTAEVDYPEMFPEDDSDEEELSPREGEKLGGYPNWIQGEEYPDCDVCGLSMTYLFQVDSEKNIPFMFGDMGCGHICYCPSHPHHLKFGWACC